MQYPYDDMETLVLQIQYHDDKCTVSRQLIKCLCAPTKCKCCDRNKNSQNNWNHHQQLSSRHDQIIKRFDRETITMSGGISRQRNGYIDEAHPLSNQQRVFVKVPPRVFVSFRAPTTTTTTTTHHPPPPRRSRTVHRALAKNSAGSATYQTPPLRAG